MLNRGDYNAPRTLLRKLREVTAEPIGSQERLDKIVTLIANNMVAEVCSVYVARSDGALELFASEGLNREAVHNTVLQVGEGMVGVVLRTALPLNSSDAQNHPNYAYKPETGEEIYHAFLGVPILRGGRSIGVLVVQNSAKRNYSEEEEEALETTSMVLAEMIASGELASLASQGDANALKRPMNIIGTGLTDGIGMGYVVLHEPRIEIVKIIADNPALEAQRLETALEAVKIDIDDKLDSLDDSRENEHREILEAYKMFANDRGWLKKLKDAIFTGVTAEAAVERVQNDNRARMMRLTDPYLRDRLHDLEDLGNRLLRQLTGKPLNVAREDMPQNAILVARHMGPAALLDYQKANIRGLVLEEAGATSHVAIVARALGIPTVGQAPDIVTLADTGDAIIIDGATGDIQLRPTSDVEAAYVERVRFYASKQAQYAALRYVDGISVDGVKVALKINAGLLVDLPQIELSGAEGIGLFRTELPFMVASYLPKRSEQEQIYRAVLDAAGDKPVTFRTLDIGGDKVLPYMQAFNEENPAMGYRAIRLGLDRKGLLYPQLRALLSAAAGKELRIMFPMVATVQEMKKCKAAVADNIAFLTRHGHSVPKTLYLGAMLEVPSLLFCLDEILDEVDFLSIGSNDLMQFFFAVDRGNTRISSRFDTLHPSFLRALRTITQKAALKGKEITLCGEMASKPLEALALIAIGFRSLSLTAASIGPVKSMLLELDVEKITKVMDKLLLEGGNLRQNLKLYAQNEGLPL
jgi:phosphotransferase system, enzyme I, PtsP